MDHPSTLFLILRIETDNGKGEMERELGIRLLDEYSIVCNLVVCVMVITTNSSKEKLM